MMDTSLRSLFPLQRRLEWALYKEAQDYFWRPDSIDLSEDAAYISSQLGTEPDFIKELIATAVKDNVLFRTISFDLLNDFQEIEHQSFIGCQITADQNQYEFYCGLLQKLSNDDNDQDYRFYRAEYYKSYKSKKNWLSSNITTRPERVVGYACLKGIIGSVSILTALLYQSERKMRGLSIANHLIRRDMELHLEFSGFLYASLKDEQRAMKIVQTAVDFETEVASDTSFCYIFHLESSLLESFIHWRADQVLFTLGYPLLYNALLPPALRQRLEDHIGITRARRDPVLEEVPVIELADLPE